MGIVAFQRLWTSNQYHHYYQYPSLLSLPEISTGGNVDNGATMPAPASSVHTTSSPIHIHHHPRHYHHHTTISAVNLSMIIIDVVSVGSITRPDYQDAQYKSFGTHPSIRHFFRINEKDDVDQACHQNLTNEDAYRIARHCRSLEPPSQQYLLRRLRRIYAGVRWLSRKHNPAGWICAQRRAVHGFVKALRYYQHGNNKPTTTSTATTGASTLPDYLIIMDDDTYFDMDQVSTYLANNIDRNTPVAMAGCIIRIPLPKKPDIKFFSFPFGGWGLMYSKEAIRNLLRPIRCSGYNNTTSNQVTLYDTSSSTLSFVDKCCHALHNNQVYESDVFQDGMSISDLMHAYVSSQPYSSNLSWQKDRGFCLHGDWVFGYFTNYYPVSIHDPDLYNFHNLSYARLLSYTGDDENEDDTTTETPFRRRFDPLNITMGGQCNKSCSITSHICHYQTPAMMHERNRQTHLHF